MRKRSRSRSRSRRSRSRSRSREKGREMEKLNPTKIDLKYFPEDFRKYVQKENLLCSAYRVPYWFSTDFYVFKKANATNDGVTSECLSLVDSLISFFERDGFRRWRFLVQFWAAEQVVYSVDDAITYRLTTRNQPFLLRDFKLWEPLYEGLFRYRMKTCDVIVAGDGRGGAIGRVFRNKRIESTPDVAYYSFEEYPHRDVALSCDIGNSIVVPWFDSYGKVVGVIEFVSPQNPYCFAKFLAFFDRSFSLGGIDRCQGLCCQGSGLINPSWSGDVFDQLGDNIESIVRDDVSTSLEPCITTFLEKRLEIAKNFIGDLRGELPNEFTEVESEVDTAEMDTNSVGSLQTTREKGKITISKTELEKQFGKSLNDAAKALGASRSTVKRNRKLHGYKRWPKSRRDIPVKVKAKYGENKFIQFELFESSGIDELQDQVAKRLKKSYIVHYPNNEDELILIACDDDLQNHISSSKTLGNEYFNILLEQV